MLHAAQYWEMNCEVPPAERRTIIHNKVHQAGDNIRAITQE